MATEVNEVIVSTGFLNIPDLPEKQKFTTTEKFTTLLTTEPSTSGTTIGMTNKENLTSSLIQTSGTTTTLIPIENYTEFQPTTQMQEVMTIATSSTESLSSPELKTSSEDPFQDMPTAVNALSAEIFEMTTDSLLDDYEMTTHVSDFLANSTDNIILKNSTDSIDTSTNFTNLMELENQNFTATDNLPTDMPELFTDFESEIESTTFSNQLENLTKSYRDEMNATLPELSTDANLNFEMLTQPNLPSLTTQISDIFSEVTDFSVTDKAVVLDARTESIETTDNNIFAEVTGSLLP